MSDWASPTAQSVRHLVYQTFAQQGRAASPAELAGELELDPAQVLDALRELFIVRGVPQLIRSDNGPESIGQAIRMFLAGVGVETLLIEPGCR